MKVIQQIIRGCGNLPHVGEHPGTLTLIFFVFLGCMAGAGKDEWGFAIGGAIMAAFMVPIYLFGAYERAEESDRIANRR